MLTKADKVDADALEAALASLRSPLPAHLELHAINAKEHDDVAPLLAYLRRGDTAVLVGSSGAGKSTLTNTLLGGERQARIRCANTTAAAATRRRIAR